MNFRRYPVIKKLVKFTNDARRVTSHSEITNAVFLNSIPKSGTHLAHQVLQGFGYVDRFGFYATTPSLTMNIRSNVSAKQYLDKLYDLELMTGHLFYSEEMENFLIKKLVPCIFIYRDPRAVFLSELHYLSEMNRWHRCHSYYKQCTSFDQQFELCLKGIETKKFYYPEFAKRLGDYVGWISSQATFSIRFENLIDESSRQALMSEVRQYLGSYSNDLPHKFSSLEVTDPPLASMSHTYTGLAPDRWRNELNRRQISILNNHLGDLVSEMGYVV